MKQKVGWSVAGKIPPLLIPPVPRVSIWESNRPVIRAEVEWKLRLGPVAATLEVAGPSGRFKTERSCVR